MKKLVFSEAISTVGKLTHNQLDLLALNFIAEQEVAQLDELVLDWQKFLQNLESLIKPFIKCKVSYADVRHLQYSSCAYICTKRSSLTGIFNHHLPLLFQKSISENEVISLKIDEYKRSKMFLMLPIEHNKGGKQYVFRAYEDHSLASTYSDYQLETTFFIFSSRRRSRITELFNETVLRAGVVNERLPEAVKHLEDRWLAGLRTLSLTSVGLVLATCHIEEASGRKYDISSWLS